MACLSGARTLRMFRSLIWYVLPSVTSPWHARTALIAGMMRTALSSIVMVEYHRVFVSSKILRRFPLNSGDEVRSRSLSRFEPLRLIPFRTFLKSVITVFTVTHSSESPNSLSSSLPLSSFSISSSLSLSSASLSPPPTQMVSSESTEEIAMFYIKYCFIVFLIARCRP